MASQTEELLLHVKVLAEGQGEMLKLGQQFGTVLKQVGAAQSQQAAASVATAAATQKSAQAVAGMAGEVGALSGALKGAGSALIGFAAQLGITAAAGSAILASVAFVRESLEAGFDVQKWEVSFEVLKGGTDAAKEHLAKLFEFAKHTPFKIGELVDASRQLEALNLETFKYLGTLGNLASFMDVPLKEAILSVSAVQRGQFESIRRFVPDLNRLMRQAGIDVESSGRRTQAQLNRLVDEVMKELDQRFGGGMDRLSQTTHAKLDRLGDEFFQFKAKVAESGLGQAFDSIVDRILARLDRLEKDGTLDRWAHEISNASVSVLDAVVAIEGGFERLRGPILFLGGAAGLVLVSNGLAFVAKMAGSAAVALYGTAAASWAATGAEVATTSASALLAARLAGVAAGGSAASAGLVAVGTGSAIAARGLTAVWAATVRLMGGPIGLAILGLAGLTWALSRASDAAAPAAEAEDRLREKYEKGKVSAKDYADELAKLETRRRQAGQVGPLETATSSVGGQVAADFLSRAPGAGARKTATPEDEEMTRAQREAFKRAVDERTRVWADGIRQRIALSMGEADVQLRLLERISAAEVETMDAGLDRDKRRHAIGEQIRETAQKAEIESNKKMAESVVLQARAEKATFDLSADDYIASLTRRRMALDEFSAAHAAITEEIKAAEKNRAEEMVRDARFERDVWGETADQYVDSLKRRLSALAVTSEAGKAILAELTDAQLESDRKRRDSLVRTMDDMRDVERKRDNELIDRMDRIKASGAGSTGNLPAGAAGPRTEAQGAGEETNRLLADAQKRFEDFDKARGDQVQTSVDMTVALWTDAYAQLLGVHAATYDQMTEKEKQSYALAATLARTTLSAGAGFAKGYTAQISQAISQMVTTGKTQHALLRTIVLESFKAMTVGAADQIRQEAELKAALNAAKALEALAEGFLGHPGAFAAAAKFGLAALKYGAIGGIAGGFSEALSGGGGGGGAGTSAAEIQTPQQRAAANTLRISEANQPITMNFYLSQTWQGGLNLFGRDAANALVQEMIPALQEAIDNHQLVTSR